MNARMMKRKLYKARRYVRRHIWLPIKWWWIDFKFDYEIDGAELLLWFLVGLDISMAVAYAMLKMGVTR